MMPTYLRGPLSAAHPGASFGGSGAGDAASSTAREMVIGPIFFHVTPLSVLRSIHAAHVLYASTLDPATTAPSANTSGFARIGPNSPAGSISFFDHVRPSSSEYIRPAAHCDGDCPTLKYNHSRPSRV